MTDDENEDRRRVFEALFQSEEQGFIRHLIYCWIYRHGPMAANPYGEAVRRAVLMLRLKRAISKLSDEELAKYKIDPSTRDQNEGWTTGFTDIDREILAIKLDPKRRVKRTCPECLKSIGFCEKHQRNYYRRSDE